MAAARARERAQFWIAVAALCLAFVWLFSDIMMPFLLGMAVAYLLNPAMENLSRQGLHRGASALLLLASFYALFLSILALVLPFIWNELRQAAEAAPEALEKIWRSLTPHIIWLQRRLGGEDPATFGQMAQDYVANIFKLGGGLMAGLAGGGQVVAGFFATLAITPIVSFFMMKEWPQLTAWIDGLLPRGSYKTTKDILHKIDRKIAGFVRGQLTVALLLALFYALALAVAGLHYGFLIGFATGLLAIIPYVSSPFGLVTSFCVGWLQTNSVSYLAVLAGIFIFGQIIETYFLTPRLLSRSVGLHPVWVIFAVMAGGSLLGMTGMLLAVPVTASAGVLVSFALERYRASAYYKSK